MSNPARILRTLAAAAGILAIFPAQAEDRFPAKPIHFIFPSTAGGVGANVMHVLAKHLTEKWKQPVLVEPRPGASTSIGTDLVAKAAPDGHTILLASSQHVILPFSMRNLPYDPIKDFAPVVTVAKLQYIVAVNPRLPVNNLQEFIALAKSKPDEITFGSGGVGGPAHLATEQFNVMTGIKLKHVPYNNRGAAAVLADLMGGHIDLYITPPGIGGYVKEGRLKALAVSGDERSRALPQVPTFAQAGLPNFEVSAWYGVLAPAATPKAIVDRIAADFAEVVSMPEVREKLQTLEVEPFVIGPEKFGALMKSDMARYAKLIKDAKLDLGN